MSKATDVDPLFECMEAGPALYASQASMLISSCRIKNFVTTISSKNEAQNEFAHNIIFYKCFRLSTDEELNKQACILKYIVEDTKSVK